MNIAVKIVLSIVLFIIGFLCMGLSPYITVLPSIGLFIASILGIVAIWKKRPVEGEGDIFKNKDKLNKD
jgi:NADH:ubiquinone oxidoreductase subunit K